MTQRVVEEKTVLNGSMAPEGLPKRVIVGRDGRLLAILAGAVVVLLSFALPMFTWRITSVQMIYSGGTQRLNEFPLLISGQHYAQKAPVSQETLTDLKVAVGPVEGHGTSGYGWLIAVLSDRGALRQHASFGVCLLVPLIAACLGLAFVGRLQFDGWTWPEGWIPWLIRWAVLAVGAIVLAWMHQFDFSDWLLVLGGKALWPRIGFWCALAGTLALLVGSLALRRETQRAISNWWVLVFVVAFLVWLLTRVRPYPYWEIWNFIADGILVTLRIVTTSFGFILLVSLLGGLGRIARSKVIYGIASLYVELIRGIPLLVQLLFIWFALPQVFDVLGTLLQRISPSLHGWGQWLIDLRLSPFTAAVLGLTICYGAYGSEIFRAGISSIHHGQMEAARSLGMTYFQAMRYIILPQAVRVILPPIGNEFVALLKDSSLVSVLAVSDLTRRGREYMARTFLSFDTWIMVALCYLVLTLFSSRAVEFIESKSKFER
ncbi:MAG: amino acid ABC transporter permease [Chloroflexi bacterium]|nr:amino acid ABC transporter permease [Chloroflexota bacterium]